MPPCAPPIHAIFHDAVVGLAADPYRVGMRIIGHPLIVAPRMTAAAEPHVVGAFHLSVDAVGHDAENKEAIVGRLVAHHGILVAAQPRYATIVARRDRFWEGVLRIFAHLHLRASS